MLYPTSRVCSLVSDELYLFFDEYNNVMAGGSNINLIMMNLFTNLGTVLTKVMLFDECFKAFNGKCVGQKLGEAAFTILDPAVVAKWEALKNNELL